MAARREGGGKQADASARRDLYLRRVAFCVAVDWGVQWAFMRVSAFRGARAACRLDMTPQPQCRRLFPFFQHACSDAGAAMLPRVRAWVWVWVRSQVWVCLPYAVLPNQPSSFAGARCCLEVVGALGCEAAAIRIT